MKKLLLAGIVFIFLAILIFLFVKQQSDTIESFKLDYNTINHDITQITILVTAMIESVLTNVSYESANYSLIRNTLQNASQDYLSVIDFLVPEAPIQDSMDIFIKAQRNYWNQVRSRLVGAVNTNAVTINRSNAYSLFVKACESVNFMDYYTDNMIYSVVNQIIFDNSHFLYKNPTMFVGDFLKKIPDELSVTLVDKLFPTPPDYSPCNAFFDGVKSKLMTTIDIFNAIATSNMKKETKHMKYAAYLKGQQHDIPEGGFGYYWKGDRDFIGNVCHNGSQSYPSDYIENSVNTFVCM